MFKPVAICLAPATIQYVREIRTIEKGTLTTTQWMPNSNRTAMHVHPFLIQSQRLYAIQRLTRERLVDLPKVDIVLRDPSHFEYARNGVCGTDTHYAWRNTDDGCGDVFSDDGEAKTTGDGAACKENGCCAIGDLRGIA
jgi:hypothetical protein